MHLQKKDETYNVDFLFLKFYAFATKFLLIFFGICTLLLLLGSVSKAAEPPDGGSSLSFATAKYRLEVTYRTSNDKYDEVIHYQIYADTPIYLVARKESWDVYTTYPTIVDENGQASNGYKTHKATISYYNKDGTFDKEVEYNTLIGNVSNLSDLVIEPSVMIFDSDASCENYVATGSKDGVLIDKKPDYNLPHDFASDKYDPDILVPELTNLSHNGFTVNNADPSRDIDIYVESKYYGIVHGEVVKPQSGGMVNAGSNVGATSTAYFEKDKSWVFNSHRYNLTLADISYSDAVINLSDMYHCTNEADLFADMQAFAFEYPTRKRLKDYSFFKYGDSLYDIAYSRHLPSSYTEGQSIALMLQNAGQAETTYYVRFLQLDDTGSYMYGQWVSYTYSTDPKGAKTNITTGTNIKVDSNGNPYASEFLGGIQNADGSVSWNDYNNTSYDSFLDADITSMNPFKLFAGMFEGIKDLVKTSGDFYKFLGDSFSFIPNSIWAILLYGMYVAVAFLIFKFVK